MSQMDSIFFDMSGSSQFQNELRYCKCLQGQYTCILVNGIMIRIGICVVIILTRNWPCMLITCIPHKVLELF